ncbi:hypothetical protein CONCODRAFT_77066 [Conidiobolus coronatus NRRL 28638]|uniref:Myb/SANT-like DNA-binding domain-containing protein n=1 Tax=Conidiobolus coronatus (strain ATCC 28846 / CBS 209.66 / NRRL 28638) TaxID=796925 RepID=A0A137PGH3_CONC2|nr:hypothetical protein CONCODRAFT_77066 [Conidiobolus coronatus NRRL 28638]|eukprot:KXN74075.1 hypothetical protein CONCODRAFT_77066 [Conidiobolus coronatus NRRL 28638]
MPKATSKARNIWSDDECIILMQAIMNVHTSCQDLNSGELGVPATFWNQVSEYLKGKSLFWEPLQCKIKWKNLKARYKNLLHSNDSLDELGLMVKYVGSLQGLHPSRPKRFYPSPAAAIQSQAAQQNNIPQQNALASSRVSNTNPYNLPIQPTHIPVNTENNAQLNNHLQTTLPTIESTIPNTVSSSNVNDIGNIIHPSASSHIDNLNSSQPNTALSNTAIENLSPEEYSNLIKHYRAQWRCNQDQQILLLGKLIDGLQKNSALGTTGSGSHTQTASTSTPAPALNHSQNSGSFYQQQASNTLNLLNRPPPPSQPFNTNLSHFNNPNNFN